MTACNLKVKDFLDSYAKNLSNEMGPAYQTAEMDIPVITLCVQPGSGGHAIGKRLAERLGFSYFDKELLKPMAICNNVDFKGLETAEKLRTTGAEDFISSIVSTEYVHPSQYLCYLKEYVSMLGQIGKAVVIGRGANFILPKEKRFAIRITAPLETRIKSVAYAFNVSFKEAKKRILNRAAKRKAFVKANFHENIEDSLHYDLIINTSRLDTESTVDAIMGTIIGAQVMHPFEKSESYILRKHR